MSESGEIWRATAPMRKEQSRKKKESNYEQSKRLLIANKIDFVEHENGHFVMTCKHGMKYDFWASTGLFINRKTKYRNRGIQNLLKLVKK